MMRTSLLSVVGLVLAVGTSLSGCAEQTDGAVTGEAIVGSNADEKVSDTATEEPLADEVEDPIAEEPEPDDGIAAYGETYEWEDGIAVKISRPKRFTRSEWASGGEKSKFHVKFTITVINGTDKKYDPSMASDTLQSGDAEADAVFDTDNGLNGSPSTTLLPGRQAKWDVGYGVKNVNDLILEFAPDWDHEAVIYATT